MSGMSGMLSMADWLTLLTLARVFAFYVIALMVILGFPLLLGIFLVLYGRALNWLNHVLS